MPHASTRAGARDGASGVPGAAAIVVGTGFRRKGNNEKSLFRK
ncbi:hypothetical protein BURMUCF2_A0040 [Burkholderia multivorans CF2]|nr:hypothetical protein BURMUCF2_A0040 [Burkholderia multivorans CF2]